MSGPALRKRVMNNIIEVSPIKRAGVGLSNHNPPITSTPLQPHQHHNDSGSARFILQNNTNSQPQPGPSRLARMSNDLSNHLPSRGKFSDHNREDGSGPSTAIDSSNELVNHYNELEASYISDFDESLIGPNTIAFNGDTSVQAFGNSIMENLRRKSGGGKAGSSSSTTSASASGNSATQPKPPSTYKESEMPKNPVEVRRKYTELIEEIQGFAEKDPDINLQKRFGENIMKGTKLFGVIGGGTAEMYIAFTHTNECSRMLKQTVDMSGNATVFKKDAFLEAMRNTGSEEDTGEGYSPLNAALAIAGYASECCLAVPPMMALVGVSNRIREAPKQKKPRAAPRRRIFDTDSAVATQHEELNTAVAPKGEQVKTRAEIVSQEISLILKKNCVRNKKPVPLLDFTISRKSLADTVEHLFYVGSLIRDGHASLARERRTSQDHSLGNLVLLPAIPPKKKSLIGKKKKGEDDQDDGTRNQFILSFSPRMWKAYTQSCTGDDTLKIKKPPPKPLKSKSKCNSSKSSPTKPGVVLKKKKLRR